MKEVFLTADIRRQMCQKTGLSELGVEKVKKEHIRSASKIVISVHQPNTYVLAIVTDKNLGIHFVLNSIRSSIK